MPAYYGFPKPDFAFTSEDVGAAIGAGFIEDQNGNVRSGVVSTQPLVAPASGWALRVTPFKHVHATGPSVVIGGIDSLTQVTIDAPSGADRIDVIVYDRNAVPPTTVVTEGEGEPGDAEPGDGTSNSIPDIPVVPVTQTGINVIKGTTSKPIVPTGMVELATVKIPANASSVNQVTITPTYQMTTVKGGILQFRTDTERTAFQPQPGQVCEVISSGKRFSSVRAGQWRQLAGIITVPKANWNVSAAPFYGRVTDVTLPTVINSGETIRVSPVSVGTGYGDVELRAVKTRTKTNTVINVGLRQFGSPTTQQFKLLWEVVQSGY